MSAGIAVGAVVAAAMALAPVRYLTRRPVIREQLVINAPPIHS